MKRVIWAFAAGLAVGLWLMAFIGAHQAKVAKKAAGLQANLYWTGQDKELIAAASGVKSATPDTLSQNMWRYAAAIIERRFLKEGSFESIAAGYNVPPELCNRWFSGSIYVYSKPEPHYSTKKEGNEEVLTGRYMLKIVRYKHITGVWVQKPEVLCLSSTPEVKSQRIE